MKALPKGGVHIGNYREGLDLIHEHREEFPLALKLIPNRGHGKDVIVCKTLKEAYGSLRWIRDCDVFAHFSLTIVSVVETAETA